MLRSNQVVVAVLIGAGLFTGYVLAGDITPPAGPVSETMKTLTDVEPRIAVNAENTPGDANSLYVINQPGSYYLTGNISGVAGKHGIKINVFGVTLDLNGFTVFGGPGSLDGVNMPDSQWSIVIRNGTVSSWGGNGITARSDSGLIEDIVVEFCGGWGISCNAGSFMASVKNCQASFNGELVLNAGGITASHAMVIDCDSSSNYGAGIDIGFGCLVRNNRSTSNTGNGLGSMGRGIFVTGGANRIEDNHVTNCTTGIQSTGNGNLYIGNSVFLCTTRYVIVAGNYVHVVAAPGAAAINGASGGTQISTDPFANFAN